MCTSTPNDYLEAMAEKYGIPMIVNPSGGDIQSDWNFAYRVCGSRYVTLVHQDDVYDPEYTQRLFCAIKKYDDIAIFYGNYRSLITRGDEENARYQLQAAKYALFSHAFFFVADEKNMEEGHSAPG